MDVRMPGMDGIEATRRVRAERDDGQAQPRVLVLTTFGFDEYVVEALRAGASGFLLKDATPEELVHAVRVVAAGHALLAPAVTSRLIESVLPRLLPPDSSLARQRSALDQLTEREREVLMLLARGQSNAEIGASLSISDATVKTHVSHVLTKLDLRDRVQAVIAAYELGLLTPGAP
jgi:DNA-binding NarL/FixJ family response regulator